MTPARGRVTWVTLEPTIPAARCPTCNRPVAICVCDRVRPLDVATPVLILQDPHEPDVVLGTAQLLAATLPRCTVTVGRHWPGLAAALGAPPGDGRWGVLWRGSLPGDADEAALPGPVTVLDRHGQARPSGQRLAGLVALDGSWSQAKSLWWRNPWLVPLDRVVVTPPEPGIYGRLRKEPNRQSVSTLEAVAEALVANGEAPEVRAELRRWMRTLVQRARDTDPRRKAPPA